MTGKMLFAILYDATECDCEACQAWYEWFDSDRTDIESAPQPCGERVMALIEFENDEAGDLNAGGVGMPGGNEG